MHARSKLSKTPLANRRRTRLQSRGWGWACLQFGDGHACSLGMGMLACSSGKLTIEACVLAWHQSACMCFLHECAYVSVHMHLRACVRALHTCFLHACVRASASARMHVSAIVCVLACIAIAIVIATLVVAMLITIIHHCQSNHHCQSHCASLLF